MDDGKSLQDNENGIGDHPLTKDELRHLRRIMRADARARWFWRAMRNFALWLTAISVAAVAIRDSIMQIFAGKH